MDINTKNKDFDIRLFLTKLKDKLDSKNLEIIKYNLIECVNECLSKTNFGNPYYCLEQTQKEMINLYVYHKVIANTRFICKNEKTALIADITLLFKFLSNADDLEHSLVWADKYSKIKKDFKLNSYLDFVIIKILNPIIKQLFETVIDYSDRDKVYSFLENIKCIGIEELDSKISKLKDVAIAKFELESKKALREKTINEIWNYDYKNKSYDDYFNSFVEENEVGLARYEEELEIVSEELLKEFKSRISIDINVDSI